MEPCRDIQAQTPRPVTLEAPAGRVTGFLATPVSDWKSAVVVVGDRGGLDDHVLGACARLADAGHAALALDLDVDRLDGSVVLSPSATSALARCTGAVTAGLAFLRAEAAAPPSRFGVVGYGLGGLVALAAGYRCQVGAAVSFYGDGPVRLRANLLEIMGQPKPHAGALLCLVGGEDEDVCPADLAAIHSHLDAFGMRQTSIVYPRTRTDFCRDGAPTYRAAEAADAWGRLLHALEVAPKLRHRFAAKSSAVGRVDRIRRPGRTPLATPAIRHG